MKACRLLFTLACVVLLTQIAWAQTRSDSDISAELQSRLQGNPGVTFTVQNGVVNLVGTVHSFAQKTTIIDLVRRVVGVTKVIDNIKVVPPQVRSDSEIAGSVQRVLAGNLSPQEISAIKINVRGGIVTLTGTLSSSYPKQVAGMLSGWVPGVVGVQNEIQVKPGESRTDVAIAADIRERFTKNPFIASQKISINVVNGVVTLQGVVDNELTSDQAESIARFTPGVVDVNNLLFIRFTTGR